ncbi:MAG: hypothetical protein K2M17_01210 [Bacilli bacterium]|nr:hypothetical protein [Bacilli bacterium]
MSIWNIKNATKMPADLAKKLKPKGVKSILLIFWDSYKDLLNDKNLTIDCNSKEDDITLEWYGKVLERWSNKNRALLLRRKKIKPVHQYPDETLSKYQGYKPTIDFCFRDWNTENSYFGAECKNLYFNRSDKIARYVATGVDHYTSGRYGSTSSENAMIGYVLSGNIPDIVNSLIVEINKKAPIHSLIRETKYKDPQYYSKHKRTLDNQDIILHHLFFDFT